MFRVLIYATLFMCDVDEKARFIKGVEQKETREMMCRAFVNKKHFIDGNNGYYIIKRLM